MPLVCSARLILASSCNLMMSLMIFQVSFTYPYLLDLGDWEEHLDT